MHKIGTVIHNERGMTLVEILGAVTIMSIVSVFLMGYLVSAMETSSDQNRRLIAANLARLKIAEVREVYEDGTAFRSLVKEFTDKAVDRLELNNSNPLAPLNLSPETINETDYRYQIVFDLQATPEKTRMDSAVGDSIDYVIPMQVTVYWTHSDLGGASGRYAVTIPSYVARLGG